MRSICALIAVCVYFCFPCLYGLELYHSLLSLFPKEMETLGCGPEPVLPPSKFGQPMTVALLLSAELQRWDRFELTAEEKSDVHKMISWLLQNSDLDGDGKPGWGLPQPWDAFANGIINPSHHPYTITTAWVLLALTDALKFLDDSNEMILIIKQLFHDIIVRWDNELWTDSGKNGFFWYSPEPADAIFSFNVNALYVGAVSKILHLYPEVLTDAEQITTKKHLDVVVQGIIDETIFKNGMPFWNYSSVMENSRPNDLIHHIYILYGTELYRKHRHRVDLPWSVIKALESCKLFWKDSDILEFPNFYSCKFKARLWGAGALLAFYASQNDLHNANRTLECILMKYGKFPYLKLYPDMRNETFYPRHAAHVLWGLSF